MRGQDAAPTWRQALDRWRRGAPSLRRSASAVLLPLGAALLVRATIVQAYHIPSSSMESTLLADDYVLAEKLSFGAHVPGRLPVTDTALPSLHLPGLRLPRSGEIVIFEHPADPGVDLIKRCVAVAGQVVAIRDKQLFVDGRPVPDASGVQHLDPRPAPGARDNFGPYRVPSEHFFVLGDNRDNSHDSRFFGAVPYAKLRARPLVVHFSWQRSSGSLGRIRWQRIGRALGAHCGLDQRKYVSSISEETSARVVGPNRAGLK